jgi:excisionase family DNA binding protein
MENWITIDECAKLLDCSKDTVRRRIKTGEIDAEKRIGNFGLQWMINSEKINKAMQDIAVVPITRAVSVAELEQAMQKVIANAVTNAVQSEITTLREHMQMLNDKLDKQDELLKNHYKLVDERLKSSIDEKNKSFWKKVKTLFD